MGLVNVKEVIELCKTEKTQQKYCIRRQGNTLYNRAFLDGYEYAMNTIIDKLDKGDW